MLHLIKEELNEQDNYSLTENGAVGYKSLTRPSKKTRNTL